MPQPHSRSSMPASVYMTVSWSGETSEPVPLEVVGGVDDDGQPLAQACLEAVREACAAHATGEQDDPLGLVHPGTSRL